MTFEEIESIYEVTVLADYTLATTVNGTRIEGIDKSQLENRVTEYLKNSKEPLPYIFDLFYDLKTKAQLLTELQQAVEIIIMCKEQGIFEDYIQSIKKDLEK